MSIERVYEGESKDGSLQKALEITLQNLDADLGKDGVRDASASWVVTEISGHRGGWEPASIKVKISAKRVPEWGRS